MDRAWGDIWDALEANLASLERHLEIARVQDSDTQLINELEQVVKEIRTTVRPIILAEQKLRIE